MASSRTARNGLAYMLHIKLYYSQLNAHQPVSASLQASTPDTGVAQAALCQMQWVLR